MEKRQLDEVSPWGFDLVKERLEGRIAGTEEKEMRGEKQNPLRCIKSRNSIRGDRERDSRRGI